MLVVSWLFETSSTFFYFFSRWISFRLTNKIRNELLKINKLFHHSSREALKNILESKTFYFTPILKNEAEKINAPSNSDSLFICCFSRHLFIKKEIIDTVFGSKIEGAIELDFNDIFNIFDQNHYVIKNI